MYKLAGYALHHTGMKETRLVLDMLQQPDDVTCGPTCLHSVYRYYGLDYRLEEIINSVRSLHDGGTLGVLLGLDALEKGMIAELITYNLTVFDPAWVALSRGELIQKLKQQADIKDDHKLRVASGHYIDFLLNGGKIKFQELTAGLIQKLLKRQTPILAGLNATYLYGCSRERYSGNESVYDDVGGYPTGHFVVIYGYNKEKKVALIADPLHHNPAYKTPYYEVPVPRLLNAILLGALTYDANLLILKHPTQE
ncbi:MAG: hypothetical protein LAT67_00860 [Balneolales bacterium]|nr:hypothetical protein [Balneolales bacterium]